MKDRLIVIVVLVISGNPALAIFPREWMYLLPTGVLALYAMPRQITITRRDMLIVAAFAFLSAIHVASFGMQVASSSLGFFVRLALGLVALRVVNDFHGHFTAVMYGLALISFVFYLPTALGVDLPGALAPLNVPIEGSNILHIGIHNFHTPDEAVRNSGMFGEPGMFAGYLILALLLAIGDEGEHRRRRLVVLMLAVVSTLSTTGYIALAFVLIARALAGRLARDTRLGYLAAVPAVMLLCAAGWIAYETLPFMKAKVVHQYTAAMSGAEGANINRIGNLIFDMEYIEMRPIAGWSPRHETRTVVHANILELASGQGNGLSGFAVKFGLVGLAVYCFAVFGVFARRFGSALLGAIAVSIVAMVLTGEQFLEGALFLTLMFMPNRELDDTTPSELVEAEQ